MKSPCLGNTMTRRFSLFFLCSVLKHGRVRVFYPQGRGSTAGRGGKKKAKDDDVVEHRRTGTRQIRGKRHAGRAGGQQQAAPAE